MEAELQSHRHAPGDRTGRAQSQPIHPRALYSQACALQIKGWHDKAINDFIGAVQADPDFTDAWHRLSQSLFALGRFGAAVVACAAVVRLRPDHAASYHNLAVAHLADGRVFEALPVLQEAIRLDPLEVACHLTFGQALAAAGRTAEAGAAFLTALRLDPAGTDWPDQAASVLVESDQHDAASDVLTLVVEKRPADRRSQVMLGRLLHMRGRHRAALAPTLAGVQLDPHDDQAVALLDSVLRALGVQAQAPGVACSPRLSAVVDTKPEPPSALSSPAAGTATVGPEDPIVPPGPTAALRHDLEAMLCESGRPDLAAMLVTLGRTGDVRTLGSPRPCKICDVPSPAVGAVDFNKSCEDHRGAPFPLSGRSVTYHRCPDCALLFTGDFDLWSRAEFGERIYNEDYARVDPDYREYRPSNGARMIRETFGDTGLALATLDYGGGDGRMAEILAGDPGMDVDTYDPFNPRCSMLPTRSYDLITCFEVMEHTPEPRATMAEIAGLLRPDGVVLFSTLLQPAEFSREGLAWWYVAPRNGHVTLFSTEALRLAWAALGFEVHSSGPDTHLAFRTGTLMSGFDFQRVETASCLQVWARRMAADQGSGSRSAS